MFNERRLYALCYCVYIFPGNTALKDFLYFCLVVWTTKITLSFMLRSAQLSQLEDAHSYCLLYQDATTLINRRKNHFSWRHAVQTTPKGLTPHTVSKNQEGFRLS